MSRVMWMGRGAGALAATLVVGCAPDERMPLSECAHGLYWADCGGVGESVIGCDRETGDCRWFRGGATARGHAASDCPPEDPCCHDNWPFDDFTPNDAIRTHVVEQLSLLRHGVIQGDDLNLEPILRNDVTVHFDLTEPTAPGTVRGGCCGFSSTVQPIRVGSSIVVRYHYNPRRWYELEILTGETPADWSARLYVFHAENREFPPAPLACSDYWATGMSYVLVGDLHLNTDDLSDLDALHGRLVMGIGARTSIESMEF